MIVTEIEFAKRIKEKLRGMEAGSVTGPGRSGAVASVYASHLLGIPFIPFGAPCPSRLEPLLVVDTAIQSGRTLRKAVSRYGGTRCVSVWVFREPPRIKFWYEVKP